MRAQPSSTTWSGPTAAAAAAAGPRHDLMVVAASTAVTHQHEACVPCLLWGTVNDALLPLFQPLLASCLLVGMHVLTPALTSMLHILIWTRGGLLLPAPSNTSGAQAGMRIAYTAVQGPKEKAVRRFKKALVRALNTRGEEKAESLVRTLQGALYKPIGLRRNRAMSMQAS